MRQRGSKINTMHTRQAIAKLNRKRLNTTDRNADLTNREAHTPPHNTVNHKQRNRNEILKTEELKEKSKFQSLQTNYETQQKNLTTRDEEKENCGPKGSGPWHFI